MWISCFDLGLVTERRWLVIKLVSVRGAQAMLLVPVLSMVLHWSAAPLVLSICPLSLATACT